MKDFKDFKAYMSEHSQAIHEDIVQSVVKFIEKTDYSDDPGAENEDYRRAWVEIGFMKMLEQYHNWLNS